MSVTVSLVVAMGANRAIGREQALLWRLPADLAHFKQLTLGHPLIMGRATFDSIGRPLPGRTSIVLTRDRDWSHEGVEVAHDLPAAIERAGELDDEVFVIGGGQVYAEALERDLIDLMVVTRVADAPDADTFFPSIDWERWQPLGSIPHGGDPSFEIVTYRRSNFLM